MQLSQFIRATSIASLLAVTVGVTAVPNAAEAGLFVRAAVFNPLLTPIGGTIADNGADDGTGTLGVISATFNPSTLAGFGITALQLGASGAPSVSEPNFGMFASATATRPVRLFLEFTQTGLTVGSPGSLNSAFAFTILAGGSASGTITSYVSASNIAFATDILLFSRDFGATGNDDGAAPFAIGTPYSQTVTMNITLSGAAGVANTIIATALLAPVDEQPVSEPATLALLGAGLLGLAAVRRRRSA